MCDYNNSKIIMLLGCVKSENGIIYDESTTKI